MGRKKKGDIIFPSELEVYDYLNDGYGICNKCGALMKEEIIDKIGVYICPACGWKEDVMDYEYEDKDDMVLVEDERGNEFLVPKWDEPDAYCKECGGPYPDCKEDCIEYNANL